jgi:hypothetical protein
MTAAMGGDTGQPLNGGTTAPVGEAVSGLVDQAARTAEAQASTTMTKAGEVLEQVAQAIRDASGNLREQQPQVAEFADTAAQRVEDGARYLRDHGAGEVLQTVQDTARRQPAIVVGGGLALGLLLGRFLRSGASQSGMDSQRFRGGSGYGGSGYGTGYEGGSGYGTGYGTSDLGTGAMAGGLGDTSASAFGEADLSGADAGTANTVAIVDETVIIETDELLDETGTDAGTRG